MLYIIVYRTAAAEGAGEVAEVLGPDFQWDGSTRATC